MFRIYSLVDGTEVGASALYTLALVFGGTRQNVTQPSLIGAEWPANPRNIALAGRAALALTRAITFSELVESPTAAVACVAGYLARCRGITLFVLRYVAIPAAFWRCFASRGIGTHPAVSAIGTGRHW